MSIKKLHLIPPSENLPENTPILHFLCRQLQSKEHPKTLFFLSLFLLRRLFRFSPNISLFIFQCWTHHLTSLKNLFLPKPNACQITCFLLEPPFRVFSPPQDFSAFFFIFMALFFLSNSNSNINPTPPHL